MNRKFWIAAILTLGLSTGAMESSMAASDWGTGVAGYIGISGGESRSQASSSDISSALSNNGLTPLSSSLDRTDTGWKLYLGYQINQNFAVEVGYIDFGKFSFSATTAGGSLGGDLKARNGGFIDILGIIPLSNNFSIFGKLGGYSVKTELNGSGAGGSVSATNRSNDWTYGIGAGYEVNRNVGVRVEWERFVDVGNNSTTHNEIDLTSVGIVFKF